MNKRQLVDAAARQSNLTREQMREALEAILEAISEALAGDECVALSTFGRFETLTYPGRALRRFDGQGHYTVEGRRVPVFKSSAALRRRVRENRP